MPDFIQTGMASLPAEILLKAYEAKLTEPLHSNILT